MKAIRVHKTGGPEVLIAEDITLPPPGPHDVCVRHEAIGVNFIDTYLRSGLYPMTLPAILGREGAGVVESVGEKVHTVKPGDRVAYAMEDTGSYAERVNIQADRLVHVPKGISSELAAASVMKGMTAHMLLLRAHKVKRGETILIHAAAGGVGSIMVQWAKHLGAHVIGTAGSEEKMAFAKSLGCDHVLNARTDDIAGRVREITNGEKLPVVYDSVGRDTFEASLNCLAPRGLLVLYGGASGPIPPIDPLILMRKGSLFLTRLSLGHYISTRAELQEAADAAFSVMESGAVKVSIGQRFALTDARAAHEALESRATKGATILIP
jgi:NADPH2:quinone reductase